RSLRTSAAGPGRRPASRAPPTDGIAAEPRLVVLPAIAVVAHGQLHEPFAPNDLGTAGTQRIRPLEPDTGAVKVCGLMAKGGDIENHADVRRRDQVGREIQPFSF